MTSRQLDEEAIFHIARDLADAAKRATYLEQVCAGDQALRERVEGLLDAHEKEESFLKSNGAMESTADQSVVTEAPGQEIGRYKLLQKIGEGGFGVVYMAEQSRPVRRKIALKIIKPGMDTHAVIARFEAERQALALMNHPNIARVLDGGTTETGRPYFVMELVKGVPVTEYCDKNQLSTNERLELFMTVCQAVQHAHQKGIIHRDLKPSNVLITLADGKPIVKVIDFGVAKATNQQLTEKTLFTAYGQMVGTPQYMSPEQAEMSCLDVDTRSDVYSLGVLLYELLTGTTPLEGERLRTAGYAEMQRLIQEEEPPKPSTRLSTTGEKLTVIAKHRAVSPEKLKHQVQGDLDWIVMKALEKDRNRRYVSPISLLEDISNYINNEPIEARPPTFGYRARKYIRRNRVAIGVVSLLIASLGIGLISTSYMMIIARRNADDAIKAAMVAEKNEQDKTLALHRYARELKLRALDALLAGDKKAENLVESAEQAYSDGRVLAFLRAFADVNAGNESRAIEALEGLKESESEFTVAAHATLTFAYVHSGRLNDFLEEMEELKGRTPVSHEDRLMLANALLWVDAERGMRLAREAIATHASPVAYTICARLMTVLALSNGDRELSQQAVRLASAAEVFAPNLPFVSDSSLFAHHVAMIHSTGVEREKHKNEALRLAQSTPGGGFGELMRAYLYLEFEQYELAKQSFIAAASNGDMHAYHLAPALAYLCPDEALDVFSRTEFKSQEGAGVRGGKAWLLAVTPGHEAKAIEMANGVAREYKDFDTRLDALCAAMLAGDQQVKATAEQLTHSSIGDFLLFRDAFDAIAGTSSDLESLEIRADETPNSGYVYYALGVIKLCEGELREAKRLLEKCKNDPNYMSSYPFYAKAILAKMERDPDWAPSFVKR